MSKTIAVIDDNKLIRNDLMDVIQDLGYKSKPFQDAETFLSYADKKGLEGLDLLIIDIVLPKITGTEMVTRLSKDNHLIHKPILFISGLSETQDIISAHESAEALSVDYIIKPYDKRLLKLRINNLISLSNIHTKVLDQRNDLLETHAKLTESHLQLKKILEETKSQNEYLIKRLKKFLEGDVDKTFHKMFTLVRKLLTNLADNDLALLTCVLLFLQKMKGVQDKIQIKGKEQEILEVLPYIIEPTQTVIANVKEVILLLIEVGLLDKYPITEGEEKKFNKPAFFERLENLLEKDKISKDLFGEFENSMKKDHLHEEGQIIQF